MAKQIGSLICEFSRLSQDIASGDTEIIFKVFPEAKQKARKIADDSRGLKLSILVEKFTEKRSRDANSYYWVLAGKLASVLHLKKEDIYRNHIKDIGNNFEIVPIKNNAKERWIKIWQSNGIGWVCEDLGAGRIEGYSNLVCYFGSSTYDSQQMSCLIDLAVMDCKEQGIETLPPWKLEAMCSEWADKQAS